MIVTLIAPAVLLAAAIGWQWSRWITNRDRRPLTADWCRVCERELRRGEVWEVRSGHEPAEDGVGGTYLAITYCRRHKPRGAVKA